MRKHIDNKHSADALKARARPLGRKYLEYFLAITALTPPPPRRPLPQQPRRDRRMSDDRRGFPPERRDSFEGDGYGKGKGKGFGKGDGSPYGKGKGKGFGKGDGSPYGKGKGGGFDDPRNIVTYRDLDAPDDDDALFA